MAVNRVVGKCDVALTPVTKEGRTIEEFYSLTYNGFPAGKIHLTIRPVF